MRANKNNASCQRGSKEWLRAQKHTRVPIVEERHFVLATRELGYRSVADAIAEVLDNGLQAGANNLHVRLLPDDEDGTVAISDDGRGMDSRTLRSSLQFGGSTRFNDRSGLGRFGMGLPCSSISQARRLEVFSWKRPGAILHSYLDIDEISSGVYDQIPRVRRRAPPASLLLGNAKTGTLVVWKKCDRIDWSNPQLLVEQIHRQLGQMFRYFLWKGKRIVLNGRAIQPIDPLFVNENALFRGAQEYGMPLTYELRLVGKSAPSSNVRVRFSELPVEEWHELPNQEKRRRGIAKGAGVSLVRAGREIGYGWYLMGEKRKENYDDWWRCEVNFGADLDEYFNPTHTKQEIRPGPTLDAILTADLESLARTLNARVRARFRNLNNGLRSRGVRAAAVKSRYLSTPLRMLAGTGAVKSELTGVSAHNDRRDNLKYSLSVHRVRDESFYCFRLRNGVLELTLNQDHPFFEKIYEPLCQNRSDKLRSTLDCLLLALVRAEAEAKDDVQRYWYTRKRTAWSNILATFLGS